MNIHAVQIDTTSRRADLEYTDGRANAVTEDLGQFRPFVAAWDHAKADEVTARRDRLAAVSAAQLRGAEYPSIDELVVALWEFLVEGRTREETGVDAIEARRQAVKTAYPPNASAADLRRAYKTRTGDPSLDDPPAHKPRAGMLDR